MQPTRIPPERLDLWLGKPAPRYTSYPPAPQFHGGVTESDYVKSLSNLDLDETVSLYIHVPFCKSLCLYCGCNTIITNRSSRKKSYLETLKREISLISGIVGKRRISSLHFGGGTPNSISDEQLQDLFFHLKHEFDLGSVQEIAMELDPRQVTPAQAQMLARCGVTRVSLGVQDFDPEVQTIIHRMQPYEMVRDVCSNLRSAGIHHINFDLLYGLPKQSPATVTDTAKKACTLKPDRVALFSYAHVPQLKKHQKSLEVYGIPTPHERLALEKSARDYLVEKGYTEIGIDHFASKDDALLRASNAKKLHRGFQGYTENSSEVIIGMGASAISQTPEGYFQNDRDERIYQFLTDNGKLPIKRGFLLSIDDRVRRAIIEQLMCNLSCDVGAICLRYGYPVHKLRQSFTLMNYYESAGIVVREGLRLRLTTEHRMAIRVICALFDAYADNTDRIVSRTA